MGSCVEGQQTNPDPRPIVVKPPSKPQLDVSNVKPFLTLFHFNDVYEIQEILDKGKMGVCNFQAFLRNLKYKYPYALTLFSGDAFSPSPLSKIFEGQQMVYCMNKLQIFAACFGNHQFDFKSQQTQKLLCQCQFPWLLGNIRYKDQPQKTLGQGVQYSIVGANGKTVGIFGVAGPDWIDILSGQYQDNLIYDEVCEYSDKMSKKLRQQQKCDIVIVLGHLLLAKDRQLASKVNGIDLVLGGHDHMILNQLVNEIPIIKSGDDFNNLGLIQVYEKNKKQKPTHKGRKYDFDVQILDIPKAKQQDIDKELQAYVLKKAQEFKSTDKLIGLTEVQLDTREQIIRNQQSRYGNFVADLARYHFNTDICLYNTGSIRSSCVLPPNKINFLFVDAIMDGPMMVLKISGSVLKQVLQHACKGCPGGLAGSFLSVSGMQYHYDYTKNPRVQYIAINGQVVEDQKFYTVATTQYVAQGGDGYDILKGCQVLIDEFTGINIEDLIIKFFNAECIQVDLSPQEIMAKYLFMNIGKQQFQEFPADLFKYRKKPPKVQRMTKLIKKYVLGPDGKLYIQIAPQIQGRIKCLNN